MTTIDGILTKTLKMALFASFGCLLFSLLLAGIFGWQLPAYIPMFFSRPFGAKQLVPFWVFFIYPILLMLFYVANLVVYKKLRTSLVTAVVFLWLSSIASTILLFSMTYVLFLIF